MKTSLLYQIGLTLIPGIGDVNAKKLVHYCGSAEAVFNASRKMLESIPGMGQQIVNNILNQSVLERAAEEITFMEQHDIKALYFLDEAFPQRLRNCYDHPLLLYYKGNANLNHPRIIAVVGTRSATSYGRAHCHHLVEGLADMDVLLISGLAYGIDACAHQKALEVNIPTVGVLGHGLDILYPDQNREIAKKMEEDGGLLTEFLSKTKPDREHFPKRNRIVAGMCDALVVIESGSRGGALITAELANSYNRDVFAVPGRLNDNFSKGCNNLIKTNRAALIESADDISYIMGWDERKSHRNKQTEMFAQLTDQEKELLALLQESGHLSIDQLVIRSGMVPSQVAGALLNLEFNGCVQTLPGKQYKAV